MSQTLDKSQYELLIIDDGSPDSTSEVAAEYAKIHENVRFFSFKKNMGLGAGRRIGIREAKYPWVVFMDDDCLADKNWLSSLQKTLMENRSIVGVEGKTVCDVSELTPFTHTSINENGGLYWGCNILFKRETALQIGNYDDGYRLLCEDIDLAWRLLTRGEIKFDENAVMNHPPRSEKFSSLVKRMTHYVGWFRLFKKQPSDYMRFFKARPWKLIYYSVYVEGAYNQMLKWRDFGRKHPFGYAKLILLLALQRIYLLFLAPKFLIEQIKLIGLKPYDPNYDYSQDIESEDAKLRDIAIGS
jgi:GT2 family glycosyltransferase